MQPSSSPACNWFPSREPGALHWAPSDTHIDPWPSGLLNCGKGRRPVGWGAPNPLLWRSTGSWPECRQVGLRPGQLQSTLPKTTSCPCSPGTGSGRGAQRPASLVSHCLENWGRWGWGARVAKVELLFQARGCRGRLGQVSLENLALSTHSLPSTLVTGGPARCPSTPSCQEHPCS